MLRQEGGSRQPVNVARSINHSLGIVHPQIIGDGVVIEVLGNGSGDFAIKTIVDKLLRQVPEAFACVHVDIDLIGLIVLKNAYIRRQ